MLEIKKIHDPDYVTPIIELSMAGLPVASFLTDELLALRCQINPDFSTRSITIGSMSEVVVLIANAFSKDLEEFRNR